MLGSGSAGDREMGVAEMVAHEGSGIGKTKA